MIKREIQKELLRCAKEYPTVTIIGPRQSGKTTLAKMTFPSMDYCSLEDPEVHLKAIKDPKGLLEDFSNGVILDEIQRVPELLKYLQGIKGQRKPPCRFILTASHHPEFHRAINQSLAGRTVVLELLPFSLNEIRQYDRPSLTAYKIILEGFFPHLHEHKLRPAKFYPSYLTTYVERDVRALVNLKSLTQFTEFLRLLAGRIGQLINYTSLANDVGVSSTTIMNWISVLKASFLLFELPPWFRNIRKRLVKSSKLYFTDVGLAAWLLGLETPQQVQRDPLRGALYENLLILEVLKKLLNQGLTSHLHFYRDSHGNEVDLLLSRGRKFTAIKIRSAKTFNPEFIAGIKNFQSILSAEEEVEAVVWYDGKTETAYQDVRIYNPILQGIDLGVLEDSKTVFA